MTTTQGYPHQQQQSNGVVASSSGKPGKENKEMLQAQELLNSVFAAYALSVGDIERGCRKVETIHYRHLSLSTITIAHPFTPIFLSLLFLPPLPTTPPSLLTTPPSQALNELMICERMAKNLALLTASGDPEGGGNPTQSVVYNQSVQCLMTKFGELEVFKLWAELQLIELRATLQEVKNRQFPVGSGHLLQASGGCFSHNPLSYLLSHILTYHVFLAYPLTYPLSYTLSHIPSLIYPLSHTLFHALFHILLLTYPLSYTLSYIPSPTSNQASSVSVYSCYPRRKVDLPT